MKKIYSIVAVLSVFLFSCSENDSVPNPEPGPGTVNSTTGTLNKTGNGKHKGWYKDSVTSFSVDARYDAILLDNVTTIVHDLQKGGTYTVKVQANNVHAPMHGVFFMINDNLKGHYFKYVGSGESFAFTPATSSYQIAPLYVDWSTLGDNSGTIDIEFSGPTYKKLTIDVKNDALLLDNYVNIIGNLTTNQTYKVELDSSYVRGPMQGLFFMYQDANVGHGFEYVPMGEAITFTPSASGYQIAPIYVDWSTVSDNSGKINVTIKK